MKFKDGDQVTVRAVVRRDSISKRLRLTVQGDLAPGSAEFDLATCNAFDILHKNLNAITLVERADPELENGDMVQDSNGARYAFLPEEAIRHGRSGTRAFFVLPGNLHFNDGFWLERHDIDGPIVKLTITVPEDDTEDRRDR